MEKEKEIGINLVKQKEDKIIDYFFFDCKDSCVWVLTFTLCLFAF